MEMQVKCTPANAAFTPVSPGVFVKRSGGYHFRGSTSALRRRRVGPVCSGVMQVNDEIPSCRQSRALADGKWFKMICGASSQDLPRIRNLSLIYGALGVDCVDVAADPAVVRAVRDGFSAARELRSIDVAQLTLESEPWIMVSVNADEDPHFRKASFEASACPSECPRPCERVCPADAIDLQGVNTDVCYGCGRCIPVCPSDLVSTVPFVHTPVSINELIESVDALEIHTEKRHREHLRVLWQNVGRSARDNLRLVAVSFPDPGDESELEEFLRETWDTLSSPPLNIELVWQTDGRPMSGDIGRGTARASVNLGVRVRNALSRLGIPGHVQLAGGTNDGTIPLLKKDGYPRGEGGIGGVAMGGYARKIVGRTLDELHDRQTIKLETNEALLGKALVTAGALVASVKS